MSERAWIGVAFGATLGLVVGLRLNAEGMLWVATLLLGALLLCPLFAWRLVAGEGWGEEEEPWVRVERVPREAAASPKPRPALPAGTPVPARRGHIAFQRSRVEHG